MALSLLPNAIKDCVGYVLLMTGGKDPWTQESVEKWAVAERAMQAHITGLNASDGKGVSGEKSLTTADAFPTVITVYRQEGYSTTKLKR